MPVLRQIALNNNAGAFVDVLATIPCRMMQLAEDEAAVAQGIQIKTILDKFATTNAYSPSKQPVEIPEPHRYGISGPVLGMPAQTGFYARTADKLVSARSNTATATTLRIIENE